MNRRRASTKVLLSPRTQIHRCSGVREPLGKGAIGSSQSGMQRVLRRRTCGGLPLESSQKIQKLWLSRHARGRFGGSSRDADLDSVGVSFQCRSRRSSAKRYNVKHIQRRDRPRLFRFIAACPSTFSAVIVVLWLRSLSYFCLAQSPLPDSFNPVVGDIVRSLAVQESLEPILHG